MNSELQAKFKFELGNLENEIDALVYRFYDLTDDEIKIVESREQAFRVRGSRRKRDFLKF